MTLKQQPLWICLILVLLTTAVFLQVTGFEFASFDDASYIPDNPHVQNGFTRESVAWAFTTHHHGYWHPVTWLAHMLVCQWFGLDAGAHHGVNLLVHIANVLLLFGLLIRMTGSVGRSTFVAMLFAIHPLHVESVAWIAELKDLLSTTFWILAVWAYVLYTERRQVRSYLLALILFAVGLMAKPMIVTLPVLLLLLDCWPLGRVQKGIHAGRLILEKIPFFLLSAASSLVTFTNQAQLGVMSTVDQISIGSRAANATVAYATYLLKMIWPDHMACLYPYNAQWPVWQVVASALVLIILSVFAAALGKRRPYLITGWLWFLVILLPVIGLVQVGPQSMADRYTYLSLVGIFIAVAWGVTDGIDRFSPRASDFLPFLAGVIVVAFAVRASFQVGTWKDSVTLFRHAIAVTEDNYMAHNNLGILLADQGRLDEAVEEYNEALRTHPYFAYTQNNLGGALLRQGKVDEAILHFNEALQIDPGNAEVQNNMGIALAKQDRFEDAIGHFLEAFKADAGNVGRQRNLLLAIKKLQDREKAATYYRTALEMAESANEQELANEIRGRLAKP